MQNRRRQVSAPDSIGQKSNPALLYPENELVRLIFRELKLAKQLRIEAEKYQQETETRARSQAHMLLLRARLATRKEIIAEFKHKASEEIEKEIEQLKRRANEEMQKEIKAEFKRKADEEIQKKITELISTADEEMQKKLTELISTADEEIQKKLTELVNTANQGMTELIGTANQEIQKEIEQFKGKVNKETHEIQQVLTDIRKMRIAADNELKIQQKLTDANRIIALTSSSQ